MRTLILRFTTLLVLTTSAFAQQRLPIQKYAAGMYVIQAEVAATEDQRATGLMNRKEMGANEGMMFIFDRQQTHCMWMKNTLIPLSVAFIDNNGVIINIEDMKPQTEATHCATKPALYALEMNANWFKQKNIKPGTKIERLAQ